MLDGQPSRRRQGFRMLPHDVCVGICNGLPRFSVGDRYDECVVEATWPLADGAAARGSPQYGQVSALACGHVDLRRQAAGVTENDEIGR